MRLAVLLLAVVTACSKTERPSPAPEGRAVGSSAPVRTTALPSSTPQDLAFVPSSVTKYLGSSEFVFAIDVTKLDMERILAQLPPMDCLGDLIKSVGVIAMTGPSPWVAFGTKLAEPAARTCFEKIDRDYGAMTKRTADGSYQIGTGDDAYFLTWRDGIAIGRENLTAQLRSGPLRPELVSLSKQVPGDAAVLFIAAHGWPKEKIKTAVMWMTITGDAVHAVFRVEGEAAGVVRPWLRGFAEGVKEAAAEKRIAFDDKWVTESVEEPIGTIEARFPLAALAGLIPL
jgi:hypothetical protein